MIKPFQNRLIPTLLILLASCVTGLMAEETKPQTAWDDETEQITGGSKYAFGSIAVPPDFFSKIYGAEDTSADDDPFGSGASEKLAYRKHPPILPAKKTPLCLPKGALYYDVSKIMNETGLSIKPPEWALLSGGLAGNNQLYFCTTWMNTDLINSILMAIHGYGPRSVTLKSSIVSVENQGIQNKEWTPERLRSLHPKVHSSHGISCRSGEKSTLTIRSTSPPAYGISEYEVWIGENNRLIDCQLDLHLKLPGKSDIKINQKSAITCEIGTPMIIDCGTHGRDQRNYLLVIHSRVDSYDSEIFQNYKIIKRLDKIEGIHALRNGEAAEQAKLPLETSRYEVDTNFLNNLREALSSQGDERASNKALIPTLVKDTKISFKHQKSDRIFDITTALRSLGSHMFINDKRERFLYNESQHQLIIHAGPATRELVLHTYARITPNARMVRVNARIVSADTQGEDLSPWTIEEIEKRNPEPLAMYSITGRSGEVSTSGKITNKTITKNKKTGKETTHFTHEFEIEPTIGEQNRIIDIRIVIHSQPIGAKKTTIDLSTALTLTDGKPTIIEFGHPSSATRTLLLILNADIIRPDGTFYRSAPKRLP